MPKLKFDYVVPFNREILGNEIDPVVVINVETGVVQGKYYQRTKRTDTQEESVEYDRPISFEVQLTMEAMNAMLAPVIGLAAAQGVLREATPVIEVPPAG